MTAWYGTPTEPAFPERVEALLEGFAVHAAEAEAASIDIISGLAGSMGGSK